MKKMSAHQDISSPLQADDNAVLSKTSKIEAIAPPDVNKGSREKCPWSKDEDEVLMSTFSERQKLCGNYDARTPEIDFADDEVWEHVSSKLSSRTAVQCLLRYLQLSSTVTRLRMECTAVAENKLGNDDLKSPSSASTSSGSSRKKRKHDESCDDWTEEETDRLAEIMLQYQDCSTTPDWSAVANNFPGKSPIDCLAQWQNISLPDQIKGKGSWTPSEDAILRDKRAEFGRKWSKIAEFLPGRSGKQCRERYVNHLNPSLKRGEWTDDEEAVLIAMREHSGNKWTHISKQLPGRSDNDVKNHYYSTIKRKFDLHGKSKLVTAAIQHVFMLVHAGRLDRNVVHGWKDTSSTEPKQSDKEISDSTVTGSHLYAAPLHDPYHAIPRTSDPPAGVPLYALCDNSHYRHALPSVYPSLVQHCTFPNPAFHGQLVGMVNQKQLIPPFQYHDNKTDLTVQPK
ncbi:hypothetical protein HJC23_008107 [Cyclotella cryptica]|uniref:Uncharacterized protein n=1 Tax=Cyclotella cryptica TaxID=29204 RepID=A0ABD3PDW8_9STRA|eukprot:CCRYP_015610-RB/>CCRYP_015610-RB protein AED:0.06 eAED:0.06 QI:212/1/1/1/0.6/0.5/6/718/454